MITEVSIRCQKKPRGWCTVYTRVYPPIHHCLYEPTTDRGSWQSCKSQQKQEAVSNYACTCFSSVALFEVKHSIVHMHMLTASVCQNGSFILPRANRSQLQDVPVLCTDRLPMLKMLHVKLSGGRNDKFHFSMLTRRLT